MWAAIEIGDAATWTIVEGGHCEDRLKHGHFLPNVIDEPRSQPARVLRQQES